MQQGLGGKLGSLAGEPPARAGRGGWFGLFGGLLGLLGGGLGLLGGGLGLLG